MAPIVARSEKNWITDPVGVPWEAFLTVGEHTTYGTDAPVQKPMSLTMKACCPTENGRESCG